ncbi:MAG: hypothetical protein WCO56_20100 [Verrucomicrobiota bacterium]
MKHPCAFQVHIRRSLARWLQACLLLACLLKASAKAEPFSASTLLSQSEDLLQRAGIGLLFDLEGYYVDQRPGGLLFRERSFLNPRLSMFLDQKLGDHVYVFLQGRADRGFDPYSEKMEARLDEYLVRWTPFAQNQVNLQIGKFVTVVGNWVGRHDSWNNPFITAPLPYENITIITDFKGAASPRGFLARRDMVETPEIKDKWLPIIWGPAYTTGASLFGSLSQFDYAVEVKNASISSRPEYWGADSLTWQNPTVSARLGWRPTEAWNVGISFSRGTYLVPEARSTLPAGRDLGDYNQTTLAYDASYAWHQWQLWGELFYSRFQVPNVGNADTTAYYLEAKYKLTAQLFAAVRWNQQLFATIQDGQGGHQTWGHNMERVDASLGYRFNRHLQGKFQYSISHQNAAWQKGEQLVAAQLTVKF